MCRKWAANGTTTTSILRPALKTDAQRLGIRNLAQALLQAVDELVKAGLIENVSVGDAAKDDAQDAADEEAGQAKDADDDVEEPKAKRAKKKRGWPVLTLYKQPWRLLSSDAKKMAAELRFGPDAFGT